VVRLLDLRSTCCGFKSRSAAVSNATPGKLFTHLTLPPSSTVGTSQWVVSLAAGKVYEGRSGIALTVHHRHWWFSMYGLKAKLS